MGLLGPNSKIFFFSGPDKSINFTDVSNPKTQEVIFFFEMNTGGLGMQQGLALESDLLI